MQVWKTSSVWMEAPLQPNAVMNSGMFLRMLLTLAKQVEEE